MKKLLYLSAVLVTLGSCQKFLRESSQTDMTPKSTNDYSELLFGNGYPLEGTLLNPQIKYMDDDMQGYNGVTLLGDQAMITANLGAFSWQPDFIGSAAAASSPNVNAFESWTTYYKLLLGANIAIQYVDNSIGSAADKAYLKGEAFTLRAYYHFMLVNLYGRPYNDSTITPDKSPGVPLRLNANIDTAYLTRNTVKEVYDQIERDLDTAHYYLDAYKENRSIYRINYLAAHLLHSRVCLYREEFDAAATHAAYVLQYQNQLFNLNDWGSQADLSNHPIVSPDNLETIWIFGSTAENFPFGVGMAYDGSDNLASVYTSDDLRRVFYMWPVPPFLHFIFNMDLANVKQPIPKSNTTKDMDRGTSWRTSEAYLNHAEACIQLYRLKGDNNAAQKALNDLNFLRSKRINAGSYADWTLQPGDTLLQWCRDERRRELVREEAHRWFDLRRYGMPQIVHSYVPSIGTTMHFTLQAHDPQYTLPIPTDVLQRNPALVQNPMISGSRTAY